MSQSQTDTSIIRYIIGSGRIKFSILDDLFQKVPRSKYKMCCLLVDGHSIFGRLYRPDNIPLFTENFEQTVADIVINFMNVLGHYRRYIATRLKLDNDIFVSFNYSKPIYQTELFPVFYDGRMRKYNSDQYEFITKAVKKAWEFICSVSNYFEGIYCIDAQGVDDFAVLSAASHYQRLGNDVLKIIYSKNSYVLQMIRPGSMVLMEKRDDSILVDWNNCFTDVILKSSKSKKEGIEKLTPPMLPILWTFAGLKSCSVGPSPFTGANGPAGICKIAIKMLTQQISSEQLSLKQFVRRMPDYCKVDYLQLSPVYPTLERRYKVLDYRLAESAIFPQQLAKIESQLIDLFDENALEDLNELLAAGRVDPELFDITNLNMANGEVYQ